MEVQSEGGVEIIAEDALPEIDHDLHQEVTNLVWDIFKRYDEELIDAFYLLMNGISNGILEGINLPRIIKENSKEGIELSDKTVKNYWLHALQTVDEPSGCDQVWGRKLVGNNLYRLQFDAPVGAALMCKDKPNAILGLSLSDPYTLKINQLQGVTAHKVYDPEQAVSPGGLMQLGWIKVLVDCAEEIAENLGLENVSIIRAENVVWTHQDALDPKHHLPLERAIKIYNDNAERFGYHNMDGEWRKRLE